LSACADDDDPAPVGAAGSTGTEPDAGGAAEPDAGDTQVSFAADIWPILTENCSGPSCHGEESFLPQHANPDVDMAYAEAFPVADLIAGRVAGDLTPIMPQFCTPGPGAGTCLTFAQIDLIRTWFEQGAAP
jgi:hypothetical protein